MITLLNSMFVCSIFMVNLIASADEPISLMPTAGLQTSQELSNQKNLTASEVTQKQQPSSWLAWISKTMEQNNSLTIRILLVFLLGLLMSLTPCIYPMIPITAGILQTQASRSIIMSFLLALSYTIGIATTFSILGLLAAFAGQAMGQLMNQPFFIIPLVILMVYLALSMIGLYDMYIPRFLQPRDHTVSGGSFVSAFIFGAMSGIIASPCLSPGLVFLLCLVTTLNSMLLGFILLFAFGIGLSVPLLIIGTFSNSLALLPSAGMWMVEVKKLFGFLMLAMCLYFLNYITPWFVMEWIIIAFALSIGSAFIYMATKAHIHIWQYLYATIGIFLIAGSAFLIFKAAQNKNLPLITSPWQTNYENARSQAHAQNKLLFADIGASFCSICKAIDSSLFADIRVREFLEANTVPVKIDGSDSNNKALLQQFQVLGFPTILLINPDTQTVIKQWGPELYGIAPESFINNIQNHLSKN